ncbi:MAG: hypothetical protein A2902_03095 [Elusimicrobia bacterium RIFCSPLOWO2_01_FULL_64_13]|nr:MAG: hypothetical protein A2902_03095 [Elusimicrobia bacterium RIFCSPLOWO2_01_FULL_64_13]
MFTSEPGNVMISNFELGISSAYGDNPFDFLIGGTNAGFLRGLDSANPFGGSAQSYRVFWGTGTTLPSAAVTGIQIDSQTTGVEGGVGIGVDVTGTDKLTFQLKGDANVDVTAETEIIGIGLDDEVSSDKISASSITLTTSYQEISISTGAFAVAMSSLSKVNFWMINDSTGRGPPIDLATPVTFYVDNIRFVDSSTPSAPTSLLKGSISLASGMSLSSTDTLNVTAFASQADGTIERVSFEHDGLSGGANWFILGVDTDTADGAYTSELENFNTLTPGSSYQIRAVAEDFAGNKGVMSAITGVIMTLITPATGFAGAAVSTGSIQWNWFDNSSNEAGFRVYSSTTGKVSPDLAADTTFWIETGLSPNTQYGRFVRPFKTPLEFADSATVARYTLSLPVPSMTLSGRTTSTLTVAWSTATGGNGQFVLKRAPEVSAASGTFVVVSTLTGNTFTYEDTGLQGNTSYWYLVVGYNGDLVAADPSPSFRFVTSDDPEIVHTALTSIGFLGNDIVLSAVVSSIRTLQSVTLRYRKIGESAFTGADFSPAVSGTSYSGSGTVPSAFVTDSASAGGFEYVIRAYDGQRTSSSPATGVHTVTVSETTTSPEIGPGGGTVTVNDGDPSDGETSLVIPAGAVAGGVQVTARSVSPAAAPKNGNDSPAAAYEFGPTGLTFAKPVTLTMVYPDKDQDGLVDGASIDETTLKLFWHDGFAWRNLGGTVNASVNTVSGTIAHFSTFGLFSGGLPAEADVRPREKIITPNGDRINDFAQFGITGDFEIFIFDIRGRRIRKLVNLNIWDGRRDDGQVAENGVYVYNVKSGRLNVSGTIGVAK